MGVSVGWKILLAASRRGNTIILHAINTQRRRAITVYRSVDGHNIESGRIYEMTTDPEFEIIAANPDPLAPKMQILNGSKWTFPAASVSALELAIA
jgi:hypothetical protein